MLKKLNLIRKYTYTPLFCFNTLFVIHSYKLEDDNATKPKNKKGGPLKQKPTANIPDEESSRQALEGSSLQAMGVSSLQANQSSSKQAKMESSIQAKKSSTVQAKEDGSIQVEEGGCMAGTSKGQLRRGRSTSHDEVVHDPTQLINMEC